MVAAAQVGDEHLGTSHVRRHIEATAQHRQALALLDVVAAQPPVHECLGPLDECRDQQVGQGAIVHRYHRVEQTRHFGDNADYTA